MPSSFSKPSLDSPFSLDGAEAEHRLREAEERLREAMAELQRRQRSAARGSHGDICDHVDVSCVANAIGNLCQSFLLSYGVRVGIGILLRAFKLARGQSYSSLLDLKVSKNLDLMHSLVRCLIFLKTRSCNLHMPVKESVCSLAHMRFTHA